MGMGIRGVRRGEIWANLGQGSLYEGLQTTPGAHQRGPSLSERPAPIACDANEATGAPRLAPDAEFRGGIDVPFLLQAAQRDVDRP